MFTIFCSTDNELKPGKTMLFWNLDNEFNCVAVTGLGKKGEDGEEIELLSHEKEGVRIAASGNVII